MTHSTDLRWRAVSLIFIYNIYNLEIADVCSILGVSPKSVKRWYRSFEATGTVEPSENRRRDLRWPMDVYDFLKDYVAEHPCFYLEEVMESHEPPRKLQQELD